MTNNNAQGERLQEVTQNLEQLYDKVVDTLNAQMGAEFVPPSTISNAITLLKHAGMLDIMQPPASLGKNLEQAMNPAQLPPPRLDFADIEPLTLEILNVEYDER